MRVLVVLNSRNLPYYIRAEVIQVSSLQPGEAGDVLQKAGLVARPRQELEPRGRQAAQDLEEISEQWLAVVLIPFMKIRIRRIFVHVTYKQTNAFFAFSSRSRLRIGFVYYRVGDLLTIVAEITPRQSTRGRMAAEAI